MTRHPLLSRIVLRLAAICILAFAVATGAQAREWQRAEMPGMIVYSDGYPHELQRWALKLRLFDALLRERSGLLQVEKDSGSPLTIYLLDEGRDIERLTGRKNLEGFYSPSSEGSYLIASRAPAYDKGRLSGQISLFHEYTHHFMYRHYTNAWPAWYREGYAEYGGAVTFDADWAARVGQTNWPRLKHLEGKPMSLQTILSASVDDFKPNEKARFYAWSWKLVQLLLDDRNYRRQLDRYLSLYASGLGSVAAARAAFGDIDALEARLHAFQPDPRGGESITLAHGPASGFDVTTLDPVASRLVDLRLQRMAGGDRKAAMADLRAFVAANPGYAEGRRELALALKDTNPAAARSEVLTALSLAPDDDRTLAIWSEIAMRQIKANPASMPADWDTLRGRLSRAIGPETRDPPLLAALFRSYLMEPRRPSFQALAAMQKAVALQPESYELRSLQVYAFALQGREAEARRIAKVLAADPHSGELGKRALEALDRARARGSGQ